MAFAHENVVKPFTFVTLLAVDRMVKIWSKLKHPFSSNEGVHEKTLNIQHVLYSHFE
jgi:hypothetical protein